MNYLGMKKIDAVRRAIYFLAIVLPLNFSSIALAASGSTSSNSGNSAALERANQAYLARKYSDASGLVSRIILKEGESAAALNLLGKIYHRQNKVDEAIAQYQKALKLDKNFTEARFDLGVALFDQGNYAQAAKEFEAALQAGANSEYQYNLAISLERLGQLRPATEGYEKAIQLDEKNAAAHYSLARLLAASEDNDRAIQEYRLAIAAQPDFPEAHNNLGVVYSNLGKYPEAIACFQQALKINPDCSEAQRNLGYAQAHTSLGVAYLSQGDSKKALDEFRKALRIDSHYADAHYNLALLLQKQGQLQEAVGHYQEAIKYDPSSAAAHNNLGVALMQMGNKQQAESEYKEALRIKADFKDAKLNLDELQKN